MRWGLLSALMLVGLGCEIREEPPPVRLPTQNVGSSGASGPQHIVLQSSGVSPTPFASTQPQQPLAVILRDDAGVDPSEADYPPINVDGVDRGSDWYCTSNQCVRTQPSCESIRGQMRDVGMPVGACEPSTSAWCFTYEHYSVRLGHSYATVSCASASAGIAACQSLRSSLQRRNVVHHDDRNISRCELVD